METVTEFTLTSAQQALYEAYIKDWNFDVSIFKGADPIDVGQVFIQCGLSGYWEGEWNLFHPERLYDNTREQYKAAHDFDESMYDIRTRKYFADVTLPFLKDGVFVDTGDGSGHIQFYSMNVDVYEAGGNMSNTDKYTLEDFKPEELDELKMLLWLYDEDIWLVDFWVFY